MPSEKFYNPTIVEGDEPAPIAQDVFLVGWGPGSQSVSVAGVRLDKSGVTRLQALLRRAKRQAF